ncbi:TonB family protein [Pseudohaliea rubra]|uniref:TolA protein n=1 Tax=Pseudohaliea rubra DSM 19751 TaxID=1265313 RepID=A0A095VMD1_9GAMM|nr:TonB family protein [Pseudohaliea rubra]KGE02592.1 TolA protein [Pseudohaliea rubra DSM 19751]
MPAPDSPLLKVLPAAVTLLLHGLLLLALVSRWEWQSERTIEARTMTPKIIEAKLVTLDQLRPAPKPKAKPKPKPKAQAPAKPRAEPRQQAKAAPAAKPTPAKALAKPAEAVPETQPAPRETQRMSAEELAALTRRELEAAVADEEEARVAVTAEEMAASYAALIQRTVVGYWSRPPSARNGMEALLAVQLVPTGEVVSVSVLRSSGDAAFDRSAVLAVEKAERFPELSSLPTREFEKTFRRFRLLFRPEDLRY